MFSEVDTGDNLRADVRAKHAGRCIEIVGINTGCRSTGIRTIEPISINSITGLTSRWRVISQVVVSSHAAKRVVGR